MELLLSSCSSERLLAGAEWRLYSNTLLCYSMLSMYTWTTCGGIKYWKEGRRGFCHYDFLWYTHGIKWGILAVLSWTASYHLFAEKKSYFSNYMKFLKNFSYGTTLPTARYVPIFFCCLFMSSMLLIFHSQYFFPMHYLLKRKV